MERKGIWRDWVGLGPKKRSICCFLLIFLVLELSLVSWSLSLCSIQIGFGACFAVRNSFCRELRPVGGLGILEGKGKHLVELHLRKLPSAWQNRGRSKRAPAKCDTAFCQKQTSKQKKQQTKRKKKNTGKHRKLLIYHLISTHHT